MITDVPTPEDYIRAGNELLVSAWCSATELLIDRTEILNRNELYFIDINGQFEPLDFKERFLSDYFDSIQTSMRSSLALVQQGVEFNLKSRICEVSPFLLISAKPESWPRDCNRKDIAFSDFRSLDAQDLVKVINTVCEVRLPDKFIQCFDLLRKQRNQIMHSVTEKENIKEIDIIKIILNMSKHLQPSRSWMDIRKESLIKTTKNVFSKLHSIEVDVSNAYDLGKIQREFVRVIDELTPAESKFYFSFDKKKKRFICQTCLKIREKEYFFELKNEEEHYTATAIKLSSTKCYCLVCTNEATIEDELEDDEF